MLLRRLKHIKKEGSILIEAIVGITILALSTTFIINASIENSNIIRKRILAEEVNRVIYNLMNEIKYNISKEYLEEMLSNGNLSLEYNEDLSKDLISKEIYELNSGNEIKIIMIEKSNAELKFKIVANVQRGRNEINIEKEFNKSWWMDEI